MSRSNTVWAGGHEGEKTVHPMWESLYCPALHPLLSIASASPFLPHNSIFYIIIIIIIIIINIIIIISSIIIIIIIIIIIALIN